jgi:integrase
MAPRHVVGLHRLLGWWQCQLHLTTLADCCNIHPAVERVVREQAARGLASQTLRHYSSILAAFCAWCVRRRYLPAHPLQHFRPPRATPRIHRRQLTSTEISRLLEACQPEHCLLYLTALCTGLRAAELRQLSLAHLDLDAGGLRLDAAWTKNRQPGFQPLPGDLIAALAASGQSDVPVACYARARGRYAYPDRPLLFVPTKTALCLAGDLRRAGIPRQTPEGILDFHSLRVTYINLVIASGATPTEAQRLARHQTVQMTLGVYGRTHEDRLHALVDRIATEVFPTAFRASSVHAQVVGCAEPASFLAHREEDPQRSIMSRRGRRRGRTGKNGQDSAALPERTPTRDALCRARLMTVGQHALLAHQQVPGGIGNFHNAFHGFAVQALHGHLVDRELITALAQADFLPGMHVLNALVLPWTSADEKLIAFAANHSTQQHDTVEGLTISVKARGGTVKARLHTLMVRKQRFQ